LSSSESGIDAPEDEFGDALAILPCMKARASGDSTRVIGNV
jgi:hypothetical protein